MIQKILDEISKHFSLKKCEVGEFAVVKSPVIKFQIEQYEAVGLGNVSVLKGSGMLGLMKMDTLIINPFQKDVPLFSYDRILAAGNDTLIIELYDTQIVQCSLGVFSELKKNANSIPDHDLGKHWYDSIKYEESISKRAKKKQSKEINLLTKNYIDNYINLAINASSCDETLKKENASRYVNGLLDNGGPSTDAFKKILGEEKTRELFQTIIFHTSEMKKGEIETNVNRSNL